MKKAILFLIISLWGISSAMATKQSLVDKMMEVNQQWINNEDAIRLLETKAENHFVSFNQQIMYHLQAVVSTLRKRTCTHLSAAQTQNRMQLLDALTEYYQQGLYPINDYLPYKNPIFIDRKGTHCAVGYLMLRSGNEALAQEINHKQKFAYINEISVKGVKEWALEQGFEMNELAWIQPGYPVPFTATAMESGLNGGVLCTVLDNTSGVLYAGGNFITSGAGASCNYVAAYISGVAGWSWVSLNNGLNGKVNCMALHNNILYVGGLFSNASGVTANNIAAYDINTGQWQAVGSLDNEVRTLCIYNNELYAGGKFTQLFAKWDGAQWQTPNNSGFIYGNEVRTLQVFDNQLYLGGDFELATGALRLNIASYDGLQLLSSGFGVLTPVNDFEVLNNRLYAGCDWIKGTDTCALSLFDNGNWQTILGPSPGPSLTWFEGDLKTLYANNGNLFIGGRFSITQMMAFGNNLGKITINTADGGINTLAPLALTDSAIYSLFAWDGALGFAGLYTSTSNSTMNHIAVLSSEQLTGLAKQEATEKKYLLYPIPAKDYISFVGGVQHNTRVQATIYDAMGKKVKTIFTNPNAEIQISDLKPGVYHLSFVEEQTIINERFIKQ
jgi:Secretion system C-terminal sorting domain